MTYMHGLLAYMAGGLGSERLKPIIRLNLCAFGGLSIVCLQPIKEHDCDLPTSSMGS